MLAMLLCVSVAIRQMVKKYLSNEQAFSLHRFANRRFTINYTYVEKIDAQWQVDLVDMQRINKENGWIRNLLIVIDMFYKFALAVTVHLNNVNAITAAFDDVLTAEHLRQPRRKQNDKGK